MLGGCPVAVGMGLEGTRSRVQCHRVELLYLHPLTRTSHTLWVRTLLPKNRQYRDYDKLFIVVLCCVCYVVFFIKALFSGSYPGCHDVSLKYFLNGLLLSSPDCIQAPVRVPSQCSRVWYTTLLPEPLLPASHPLTATAAAVTPPCAPPPQAWSPADVPQPASSLCARSPPLCSSAWAPPPTLPVPLPLCPATASLPANATPWWAS